MNHFVKSVRMRKNTDQDNFKYDTFHAVKFVNVLGWSPREIQKFEFDARTNFTEMLMTNLQTHHVASTLKRRRNDRFHVVSTWIPRGVFVG